MAKNDMVLLDGIIDDRIEMQLPSTRRDEVFEYLAFEQILKDADLSRDEIESGSVDGRNDGGIDGFFILVNGTLLSEPESFVWPRTGSELDIWIITCKHHDTFQQAPLDNLAASLTELLDFSLNRDQLKGSYSEEVVKNRENLRFAYRKLSARMRKFTITFAYASRGDTSNIGESVAARAKQIESIAKDCFGLCSTRFTFYGCTELIELHRKVPNFSLELPFLEVLSKGERYVLLAQLKDYYRFISDNGKLRRYLFDSNVRDYMGLNRVNEDIKETLDNNDSPDFWWLNNGVTILATSASVIGKSIQVRDIQIVNGLQTTESIFRYFEAGGQDPQGRSVLIKIIISSEEVIRDAIIRATNNQTDVELASLHATDKIQRDIEDILERNGIYYERRKNYHKNLGRLPSEIITPLYLAAGFVSLVERSPHTAQALKSRFMRSTESYNAIFSAKMPISVWPQIAILLRKTDDYLTKHRPIGNKANLRFANEKFLKNWRHLTCLLTLAKLLGTFDYSANELIRFDSNNFTDDAMDITWKHISQFEQDSSDNKRWRRRDFVLRLSRDFSVQFKIDGINRIDKNHISVGTMRWRTIEVDWAFALKVEALLPPQPWKPGLHKEIATKLGCTNQQYFSAVKLLIDKGLRHEQKDGVVYDSDGNVLCFDPHRVNPHTLTLLDEPSDV